MKLPAIYVILLIATAVMTTSAGISPICIRDKINEILGQPIWNPPATISLYFYRNQLVYLLSSNCCDQFNYLYDIYCKPICAPSGGFTGRGDGQCTDFQQSAISLGLTWQDPRSKKYK